MNDKIKNQMSAFLDDELPQAEAELLLRRLAMDNGLGEVAARYLLIGRALRGERIAGVDVGRRVAAALDAEDTHAAAQEPGVSRRWLRPVAGVGVAATVAVVALMGLQGGGDPGEPEAVTAGDVPGIAAGPSPFEYVVPADAPVVRPVTAVPARLTNYMISHGERAGTLMRSGMHSRILTYGSDGGGMQSATAEDKAGAPAERLADEPAR